MRKEWKKMLCFVAVGTLVLGLTACGVNNSAYIEEDWSDTEWDSDDDWGNDVVEEDDDWGNDVPEDDDWGNDAEGDEEKTQWELDEEREIESYWELDEDISPVGGSYTFYTDGTFCFSGGGGDEYHGTYEYTEEGLTTTSEDGYVNTWTANKKWDTLTSDEGSVLYLN